MSFVDLHTHSTASDGTLAPRALVVAARQAGVAALALTDHDTVAGVNEARAAAARLGVAFINGVEVSCGFPRPGVMHILGYGVDADCPMLAGRLAALVDARTRRNDRIIDRLNEMGVRVTRQAVARIAAGGVTGRPHIAQALVEVGAVGSIRQAFQLYLAPGAPAYFDKDQLDPRAAIDLIRSAGGVAVLAHPAQLRIDEPAELQSVVSALVDKGLGGIEVLHSDHGAPMIALLHGLAERFGLLKTGGSDFHGHRQSRVRLGRAGSNRVPREWFDRLRDAVKARGD